MQKPFIKKVVTSDSSFSQLIGNEKAKATLLSLVNNNKLPKTLLFHGPDGIGKGLFALETAKLLINTPMNDHPDIYTIFPDPKTGQHLIGSIRNMQNQATLSNFASPYKVFIIHDAEKMADVSSNALLKILEEPFDHIYFFLLSSQIHKLLPTIISRCVKIPFFGIPDDILGHFILTKYHSLQEKKITFLAQGSVGKALKKLSSKYSSFSWSPIFHSHSYEELRKHLSHVEEPNEENMDGDIEDLFEGLLYWVRENEPLKLEQALTLIQHAEQCVQQHVKIKNILEIFFIKFLNL